MNYTHKSVPSTWKEDLQAKVNNLEQTVDSKEADIGLLQNEITDVLSVSVAMTNITCIVADMLQDNIAFVSKNGMTIKAKESRDRLLKLLDITETLNMLSGHNVSLKLFNKQLVGHNQRLRILIQELQGKLTKVEQAANF